MDNIKSIIMRVEHEAKTNRLKAIDILKDGIADYPQSPELLELYANMLLQVKQFSQAGDYYRKVIRLKDDNAEAIFKLAFCYLMSKEYEQAIKLFEKIADIIPEAAYNKCIALCQISRTDLALEELEHLTADNCQCERTYLLLAKVYIDFERYHKAIMTLNTAEKKFGSYGELHYVRGLAHFRLKNWLAAYTELMKAEHIFTPTPVFYRMYSLSSEIIGKTEKAVNLLRNCIKEYPRYYAAYYDLIELLTIHKQYRQAAELLRILSEFGLSLEDRVRFENKLISDTYEDIRKNQ